MKHNIYLIVITIIAFNIVSCNTKVKPKENKTVPILSESNTPSKFSDIWKSLPLKNFPTIDTTNFDNIIKSKEFKTEEIKLLKLNKIYPEIEKESSNFKVYPSYKLDLSDQYYTLIINIYKGENELEVLLVNYSKDERIISYKVISHDEIAEAWSRKHSEINNYIITIIDEFYGDNKQIDTTKFHINRNGEMNEIRTKFNSKLRPNKSVLLNQIYTDTIEFKSYNDQGDYFILSGKKNGIDISIVYNWEWEEGNNYNFRNGDIIKLKWKMDSIWIAGDGETLDFWESAIDAEKIKNGNVSNFRETYKKPIKYYSFEESDFTDSSLDEIYLLVEYYLANSKDELVQLNLKENASLICSIEQREIEGKEYIAIGISNDFETHTSIIKWLYYENGEREKMYEYDIVNDKLIEFK